MNYNQVKGPNTLATFLIEGLSDETLLRIYKEKQSLMFTTGYPTDNPSESLQEHVSNLFYTAGYNMVMNMHSNGYINACAADKLYNQ